MSENQQPLTEEEQAQAPLSAVDAEELPETAPDGAAAFSGEQEPDAPEEEEDIDPADVKIFGLPRVCFHFTAGGLAAGYIVCGLLGMLAQSAQGTLIGDLAAKTPNVTICAIACAAIGYLIGSRRYKKRLAEKEAAESAAPPEV